MNQQVEAELVDVLSGTHVLAPEVVVVVYAVVIGETTLALQLWPN